MSGLMIYVTVTDGIPIEVYYVTFMPYTPKLSAWMLTFPRIY